jgi:nucleotide-binding universal stress UspA family protein
MPEHKPYVIVVGVDQSETGDLALEQALAIGARQAPAEIHAISVVTLLSPPSGSLEYSLANSVPAVPLADAGRELERHVQTKLGELQRNLALTDQQLPRVVGHVRLDMPAREIAQLAADLDADLVVVGTHGRRGLARVLVGSVAEATVRLAPCPVLVVRPKQIAPVVTIDPPCPECVKVRQATQGQQFWCDQHSERHGQRHTYHQRDRVSADGTLPLVFHA